MKTTSIYFLKILCLLCVLCGALARGQEAQRQYLSGRNKDDAVPWKFFCTSGANSGFWTNLPVPSQWDVKGFGTLTYRKDQTNAWDERGLYEHDFTVPSSWAEKRIFLVFEGVMTDTDAKLNGQSVGPVHQGGFYRFKYEVTPLVKFGETNKLEVTVSRHSENQSVNKAERLADYWVFAGIYRPVYLEAEPQEFIERVAIDARADGVFSADVYLNDAGQADQIEAQIQTLDGKDFGPVFRGFLRDSSTKKTKSSGETPLKVRIQAPSPNLWTAETPNLYQVRIRLKKENALLHAYTQRFGFRTFEVRDGEGLYLNGKKIILKGVNRHSFWPDSGRTLSEEVHRLDIQTMKDANINAVRMSHYPPDAQFLDLCDELGLYVLDELAGWHNFYDNNVGPKLVREMIARDVNHPSILFWDNGNEGGFNTNLDHIFIALDPQQRRVLHPWATFSGLCTAHYLAYDKAQIAAGGTSVFFVPPDKEVAATNDPKRYIYMPTEFMHGLYDGGAGAGLEDYWRMMMSYTNCAGGFIWSFLDEGVKRPDTGKIDVAGNQAPDGIVGPYRQREGSFYAIKEVWSPVWLTKNENNSFTVENRYSFIDASQCKFEWEWRRFARPDETNSGYTVVSKGTFRSPVIPPGGKGELVFDEMPKSTGDALAIRVTDPGGRELWTWVWPSKAENNDRLAHEPASHHAIPTETNGIVEIHSGDLTASFSKQTGLLLGVQRGEQKFSLTNGPRLAVGNATLRKIHFDDDGPDAFVSATYDGDLKSILWRVNGNGWIQCQYTYMAGGTNDYLGVTFDYPEEFVIHKRWLGDGPFRVWQNRQSGVTYGVWDNDYNDTLTGWRGWEYPEFKGFFAHWRWLQLDTKEGPITVVNAGDTKFLQVLTPGFVPTNLMAKAFAPVPKCGLGFLDAIPPIGTKFKEARFSGPQGQPSTLQGEISGWINFYFGQLPVSDFPANSIK